MHCVDVEFLEKHTSGEMIFDSKNGAVNGVHTPPSYPHRIVLLRPELLASYRDSKLQTWIEEKVIASREKSTVADVAEPTEGDATAIVPVVTATTIDAATGNADAIVNNAPAGTIINAADFHLTFNPDAFIERKVTPPSTLPTVVYDPEDQSTKEVRNASIWLRETAIPNFVVDAVLNQIGFADAFMLTRLMHRKGINMRYLGVLADVVQNGEGLNYGKNATKEEIAFGLQGLKVHSSLPAPAFLSLRFRYPCIASD